MKFNLTQKQVDTIFKLVNTPNLDLVSEVKRADLDDLGNAIFPQLKKYQLPKKVRK
jgi:hypothetical protein